MSKPGFFIGVGMAVVLIFVYFSYDPVVAAFFPACPMKRLFNIDCPGCGSQRAVHALLHGKIYQALDYNLLLVLSLPLLMAYFGSKLITRFTGKRMELQLLYHPAAPKVVLAVVLLFWIIRNIDVYPLNFLAA